jgi:hypothetical protein
MDAEEQQPIEVEVTVDRRSLAPGLPATRYPLTAIYVVVMLALLLGAELFQWRI